jgi:thiol-disulfide isomerase/thioredoxin
MNRWTAFSYATLILVAGCGDQAGATKANKNKDAPAVDLKILDYDGIQALIKSHQGKVVVMDCWSTSCEPCKEEFPGLVRLQKEHGDKVACISLSFDYDGLGKPEDKKKEVLAFLREQNANLYNVLSNFSSDDLYTKLDFPSIPAVFVYDRDGKLFKKFENSKTKKAEDNFTYKKDVEPLVKKLLTDGK